jgi:hypothetical protein
LPQELPEYAVDGSTALQWGAGDGPPQWIEIDLETPQTINSVTMQVAQYPAGETRHQVWAISADGQQILLREFVGRTDDNDILTIELPIPLADVQSIRVNTLESPSWVAWKEIEVYDGESQSAACVVSANGSANLRAEPSTSADIAGALSAGQGALIAELTVGDDGFRWYGLLHDVWVREDVVTVTGDCD